MSTNLQFINSFKSAAEVTSFNVTNCFSASYDLYYINIDNIGSSTTGAMQSLRFIDSSGNVISDSEYRYGVSELKSWTGFDNSFDSNSDNKIGGIMPAGNTSDLGGGCSLYIFTPFNASSFTYVHTQSASYSDSGLRGTRGIGIHKSAESITGFQFVQLGGSNFQAKISVYGVE